MQIDWDKMTKAERDAFLNSPATIEHARQLDAWAQAHNLVAPPTKAEQKEIDRVTAEARAESEAWQKRIARRQAPLVPPKR